MDFVEFVLMMKMIMNLDYVGVINIILYKAIQIVLNAQKTVLIVNIIKKQIKPNV